MTYLRRFQICLSFVLVLAPGMAAQAAERFLLQGLFDFELYNTDASSIALSRNGGDLAALGRLQLWSALQLGGRWQAFAFAESEFGNSPGSWEGESQLQQAALRWTSDGRPNLVLEVGKFLTPSSAVMARTLSSRNPLIGEAASTYPGYPKGIRLSGSSGRLDFRAALVDSPWIEPDYLPATPSTAYRPDLGLGLTPVIGLRLGVFYTAGPYLNRGLQSSLPAGTGWRDFDQRVRGVDVEFSRGYLEFAGMVLRIRQDLPFRPAPFEGTSYVLELKYTWTPRLYSAVRLERNQYAFIRHLEGNDWLTREVLVRDFEIGVGYRFNANTQLKLSYRADRWEVGYGLGDRFPDGHSIALQFSHHFDVRSWIGT